MRVLLFFIAKQSNSHQHRFFPHLSICSYRGFKCAVLHSYQHFKYQNNVFYKGTNQPFSVQRFIQSCVMLRVHTCFSTYGSTQPRSSTPKHAQCDGNAQETVTGAEVISRIQDGFAISRITCASRFNCETPSSSILIC